MVRTVSAYEQMKGKLQIAEAYHKRAFSQEVRNTSALVLKNTLSAYESIGGLSGGNSAVAQLNPISSFKNYVIKLATIGIPALDVFDWVATEAMATANTQILFTRYVRMSNKGKSRQGDVVADPFGLYYRGDYMKEDREDATDPSYSSANTVDAFVNGNSTGKQNFVLRWKKVRANTLEVRVGSIVLKQSAAKVLSAVEGYDATFSDKDTAGDLTVSVNYTTGAVEITTKTATSDPIVISYEYDNVYLPAEDIPTYGASVEAIPLVAKPHKVRIAFDALSNLIYKNDYGIDIAAELPKKAIEDYMYSIATEVSDAIIENAPRLKGVKAWGLQAANGFELQHYASFATVLSAAAAAITKITKVFAANRVFIGQALMPIIPACPGFQGVNTEGKVGTQLIGTLNNFKIYYKPDMPDYDYVVWSKGKGTEFCVGLLGMYMAALPGSIVPTQLLETPDGLNQQGFYALYDFKIINPMLSVRGTVSPAA